MSHFKKLCIAFSLFLLCTISMIGCGSSDNPPCKDCCKKAADNDITMRCWCACKCLDGKCTCDNDCCRQLRCCKGKCSTANPPKDIPKKPILEPKKNETSKQINENQTFEGVICKDNGQWVLLVEYNNYILDFSLQDELLETINYYDLHNVLVFGYLIDDLLTVTNLFDN